MRFWLSALLVVSAFAAANPPSSLEQEARLWWSHVEALASDAMAGRNTGSPEHKQAAQYVAQEFERTGLKAGGSQGYLQPVAFSVRRLDEPNCSLELLRDGNATSLELGKVANISARTDPSPRLEAGLVFVGYGLTVPEHNWDDLAGLDLKGKIIVKLGGGPKNIPGPLKSHYGSAGESWKFLKQAGVIGIVRVQNPKAMDVPWERATLARTQPSMSLADESFNETKGLQVSIELNPAEAEVFFAGSGHTFAEILAASDADQPLPRFALPSTLRLKSAVTRGAAEADNVIGIREGSDPKLRNEVIVFSAHLDHVGVGAPINGDAIYNGAMDNASGVASLIEIARQLRGRKLKRSVAFVAVTAEEKGLLGSKYFANRPTLNGRRIVANLNMDMYLPIHALKMLSVQGLEESTLGDRARAAGEKEGLKIIGDTEPERNLFVRSDQYSFIRLGVPALAFKFGYEKGSPEEQFHKDWLKQRYHAPSDDLLQPVDKQSAAKLNRLLATLTEEVANSPEPPRWKPDSFFRRFAR